MNITTNKFTLPGESKDCIRLICTAELTSTTATELRNELNRLMKLDFPIIYIDTKDVIAVDLSGINEIIHSYYTLTAAKKKMVFVYRKNSAIEKWVSNTSLDKFVPTELIP